MSKKQLFRKSAEEFATDVLVPVSFIEEKTAVYTKDAVDKMASRGFLNTSNYEETAIIAEEFGKQDASMAEVAVVANVTAEVLDTYGIKVQGMTGYAVYEEGVSCGEVSATEISGSYTITGKKIAVALGGVAEQYIVIATLGEALAAFLIKSDDVKTEKFDKLGLRSYPTADLIMENAPAILVSYDGAKVRAEVAAKIDILNCFVAAGLADTCVKMSAQYSMERVQFGMPIGHQPAVKFMLADVEISRFNLLAVGEKALACLASGEPYILEAAAAKKVAEEAIYTAANNCLQIHAGTGYFRDYPVERYYREAKTLFTNTEKSDYPEELIGDYLLK